MSSATVFVDERLVGIAPLDRDLWLDPGEHVVFARLDDRTSRRTTIGIAAGETKTVALDLAEPTLPAATVTAAPDNPLPVAPVRDQQPDGGVETRTLVVIGGAVLTVVAGAVGIVYTGKANSTDEEVTRLQRLIEQQGDSNQPSAYKCSPSAAVRPAECDQLRSKNAEYDRARNTATGAFIAAGALGVATAGVLLFWPDAKPPSRARLSISPRQLGRAPGVLVTTTF